MQSTVVEITDWARPHVGRKVHHVDGRRRIETPLRRQGLIVGRGRAMRRVKPFVVTTNGKDFLLAKDWKRCLADGEVLIVIAAPPAGGGGSKILAIIAIIALSVFTAGIAAGLLATAGGLFAAGSVSAALLAGAVSIAGTTLINALTPQPKPPAGQNRGATSPNYSIGAQGNTARLMESMPVLYGRFRIYPDYAAQPYTDYRSNDQYLYQLFVITQGKMQIEKIRIDETDVASFTDVQYEVIPPGGQVSLFPDNIVTSEAVAGIQLEKPNDGGDWSGPFVTNPPQTSATRIGIDIGWPGGLYRYNDKGKLRTTNSPWSAQAQRIDDQGNPIGDWFQLIFENKTSDSEKPIYTSYTFDVAAGRYQVRLRRGQPDDNDGQVVDTMSWQALKAYLPSHASYGDCTMLAVAIKAGAQVNGQTSRKVNVIGTRILPVWNGAVWAEQPTRNPAWAIADAFRNATYGRAWPDSRINLAGLLAHSQTWAVRGDTYDGVFDTKMALWDAVTQIARAGRAVPMYFAGVVEIIRDTARTVPTLMISPDSIVEGSLKIDYVYPTYDSPDHVIVEYTNPNTWQPETVPCALTGSPKLQPKNVQLPGVISRDQAFREGMYMAASNRDQRKFVTVQVEMEGYIPRYGDRIDIAHDVPQWGISGRIVDYDEATGTLTTSEPLAWYNGQSHFVALRALDGSAQGPYRVLQGDDLNHMVLTGLTQAQKDALWISDGSQAEPTAFAFGPGSQQFQSCLLLRATPQGDDHVELYMVNYAPSVYLAEVDASVPPPGSPSLLTPASGAPDVGDIGLNQNEGSQTVHLWVAPVPGAVAYEFEISYDGGITWSPVGTSAYNYIDAVIPPGTWMVRARAISAAGIPGGWTQNPVTVNGKPWPLGALQSLTTFELVMAIRLVWALPTGFDVLDAAATEIRIGTSNNFALSSFLCQVSYPTSTFTYNTNTAGEQYFFWARLVSKSDADPGPWFGPVVGITSTDATAILAVLTGKISSTQLSHDLLAKIEVGAEFDTYLNAPDWSAGAAYPAATIVAHNGRLWRAVQAVPAGGAEPGTAAAFWEDVGGIAQTAYGQAATIHDTTLKVNDLDGQVQGVASQVDALEITSGIPVKAGADTTPAGANTRRAGIYTYSVARVDGDLAEAIKTETLSAQVNTYSASIQTIQQAQATLDGRVSASVVTKVAVAANGQSYYAGVAIGVDYSGGTVTSQVLVNAATFAVFDASSGTPPTVFPFVIQGGQAFINQALIGTGWITNAMIGNQIASTAVNASGLPVWEINKSGTRYVRGNTFTITEDSNGWRMTNAAGINVVEIGVLT
ncbi:MAG: host specificity factor TipJ family phage tail protein [Luteibacter sp.]